MPAWRRASISGLSGGIGAPLPAKTKPFSLKPTPWPPIGHAVELNDDVLDGVARRRCGSSWPRPCREAILSVSPMLIMSAVDDRFGDDGAGVHVADSRCGRWWRRSAEPLPPPPEVAVPSVAASVLSAGRLMPGLGELRLLLRRVRRVHVERVGRRRRQAGQAGDEAGPADGVVGRVGQRGERLRVAEPVEDRLARPGRRRR